jgi:pectate lyase
MRSKNFWCYQRARIVLALAVAAGANSICAQDMKGAIDTPRAQALAWARQSAPADGWAAQNGGTQGGAEAGDSHVYTVSTADELRSAAWGFRSRIVLVKGTIDVAEGRPFSSTGDQKVRGIINVGSNTTIVGIGSDAKIINGNFMIEGTSQVILRNLTIENPCDAGPKFDPGDGPNGAWNSEFDGVSINSSNHVWIDHVTFTDGSKTNDKMPVSHGHVMECHDGAVDIKKAANYITISNSVFTLHDKNNLVGHSDSAAMDKDFLKVTFYGNLFRDIGQRTPRVRYGQVHVYNNAYIGSRSHVGYPYVYSIGIGIGSRIISENNSFAIDGVNSCSEVLKNWGGKTFVDNGSVLNGKPLAAEQCGYDSNVGWKPPYAYTLRPTEQLEAYVLAHAGAGKLDAPMP